MRIKLVNPPGVANRYGIGLPYGLGVLAAFLRKNDFSVDLEDLDARLRSHHSGFKLRKLYQGIFNFYESQIHIGHYTGIADRENNILANKLLDLVNIAGCDIAGIKVTSSAQILSALLLAEKIKKKYKIPVILGGPYVTTFADLFFKQYDFIDYAIVGEGEVPLLKLLHCLKGKEKIRDVPSLWYRNNSQIAFNGRRFYNIEDQSCPDFDSLSLELYERYKSGRMTLTIPYSTSRGCTHKCSFCIYPDIDGPWQTKSVEKVINDLSFLKEKYKSTCFNFEDSSFNILYRYVDNLCDEFIKNKITIQWRARAQTSNMDKKLLVKMKEAGCSSLCWGIESGSNRILRLMRKKVDIERQLEILRMAKEVGIYNLIYLIVGYPNETVYDLEQTALLLKNYAKIIDEVLIFRFRLAYGSYLFNNAEVNKIKIKEHKKYFFCYTYEYEEIERKNSIKDKKKLLKLRQKVIISSNYILSKKLRFPYNIMLKFLGLYFQKIMIYLLRKTYFSERLNKDFLIRKMFTKLEDYAKYTLYDYL